MSEKERLVDDIADIDEMPVIIAWLFVIAMTVALAVVS
jgi:hypothetical protein